MLPAVSGPAIAIPIGAAMGLPPLTNAMASAAGNIFPVPFIIFFIRKIFAWMRKTSQFLGKIANKFEGRAKTRGLKFRYGAFIGLLLFVAVPFPVPGMGAWTGALIATVIDVRFKTAMPAIALGIIISSVITTVITYGLIAASQ